MPQLCNNFESIGEGIGEHAEREDNNHGDKQTVREHRVVGHERAMIDEFPEKSKERDRNPSKIPAAPPMATTMDAGPCLGSGGSDDEVMRAFFDGDSEMRGPPARKYAADTASTPPITRNARRRRGSMMRQCE